MKTNCVLCKMLNNEPITAASPVINSVKEFGACPTIASNTCCLVYLLRYLGNMEHPKAIIDKMNGVIKETVKQPTQGDKAFPISIVSNDNESRLLSYVEIPLSDII